MKQVLVDDLLKIDALNDVPAGQLQWLIDNSTLAELEEGDFLFTAGDPITGTYIILKGEIKFVLKQAKGERTLGVVKANEITGYLPFSRGLVSTASGQADVATTILSFPREKSKALIKQHFELTQALVHVMTSRVRDFTALQQQNEKMMALGKLSAGLAHELNNPAAAIVRGSTMLQKHLQLQPDSFKKVISTQMTGQQVDDINNILFEVLGRKDKPVLTMMKRMELEEELLDCLEEMQVDNSAEVSENFVEFGFTCTDLQAIETRVTRQHLSPVLNWMNNNLVTEKMVNDIREASQRIEKLISSVKNFTQMDRDTDKQFTNIHQGIASTLNMLDFKRRKGNVQVIEHYDTSLPEVKVFVGELNQVWTNIFDNALDAMEVNQKGTLEIETKKEKNSIVVSITDDGVGIPPEVKDRIFDPFFTTKDIGKGTGLGLDVVTRIVKQHNGAINVVSVSGKTTFRVCFPIQG